MSGGDPADAPTPTEATVVVRVRYAECDPMGVAHHSAYAVWFEMARTELLRVRGVRYRDVEAASRYFVVARLNVRYRKPAAYDDELSIAARVEPSLGAKLVHTYAVRRGETLIATGETTLACVDASGKLMRVPDELLR